MTRKKQKEPAQPEAVEPVDEAAAQKAKERKAAAAKVTAQLMTRPSFGSAHTSMSFVPGSMRAYGEPGIVEMWEEVRDGIKKVIDGDMTLPVSMLMGQALSLQSVFNFCADLAGANVGKNLSQAEVLMRMALKAQAQCTQTLRVLGELKNPKAVAFIKQQNNATTQQVNNGPVTQGAHAHGEKETSVTTNELLTDDREAQHATTLDTGAAGRAGRENQTLAAVEVVNRAAD
jgi:hypothetical protein